MHRPGLNGMSPQSFGLPASPPKPPVASSGPPKTQEQMKREFEAVRQQKPETAEYRVVFKHGVAVRNEPWGTKIALKNHGDVVKTNVRTIGGDSGDWVRLLERFGPLNSEGWMLVDGSKMGLGPLLQRVDKVKRSRVQRCA
eukprot:6056371-Prymnesium_polylepis.1